MSGMRGASWSSGRHRTGAVAFWTSAGNRTEAVDASELFLNREIWANSPYYLQITQAGAPHFIPTGAVEEVFIDTLLSFVQVAREALELSLPVAIKAGLAGVKDYRLAVDLNYFSHERYAGHILRDDVLFEQRLTDWSTDPFNFLHPLFVEIYDAAGIERPDVRAVGRSQR